jgi:hypothetical protein
MEGRLPVLDEEELRPGAVVAKQREGAGPGGGDRGVGLGQGIARAGDAGGGQRGERGGQPLRHARWIRAVVDAEAVLGAVLAGEAVGEAQEGVDAAPVDVVKPGDEPLDGADLAGTTALPFVDQPVGGGELLGAGVQVRSQRQRLGLGQLEVGVGTVPRAAPGAEERVAGLHRAPVRQLADVAQALARPAAHAGTASRGERTAQVVSASVRLGL